MEHEQQITNVKEALMVCKKSFVAVGVFSFVTNILMLTPMFYMINVYDKAVAGSSIPTLNALVIIAVFLYLILMVLEWTRSKVLVHIGNRLDVLVAPRLYQLCFWNSMGNLNAKSFDFQPLVDLNSLRQFLGSPNSAVVFDLPWIPLFLLLMYFFHPVLAIVAVICIAIMAAVAIANQRLTTPGLQKANALAAQISSQTQRHLRNAEVVGGMGMISSLTKRWRVSQDEMLQEQFLASSKASGFAAAIKVLGLLMQSAAITTGAFLAIAQEISPGLIIGAALLLGRTLQPINQAVTGWKGFVEAKDQYDRLSELMDSFPPTEKPLKLPPIKGQISAENITVVPPNGTQPALEGVSFSLEAGQTTMILGPSAAGKSTLIRAVLGLWPTAEGAVRIDGAEPGNYDREELGAQIGYLPQDIELFDGTVADNIARFGEVDAEFVIQAAQDAGIHEMVLALPEGYDTVIRGQSGMLSPGQRQRMALARALYKRPKILIMDEPNSNLDQSGDEALTRAITIMKQHGATIIMVSHKQSVLGLADTLMIIGNGKILQQGQRDMVIRKINEARSVQTAAPQSPTPGAAQE